MKILNMFRVVRAVPTGFAESVSAFSADVALDFTILCVTDAVLPVSFASTFRTLNGR